jgi:hypothetical protein
VTLLAPHLTSENVLALVDAACHRRRPQHLIAIIGMNLFEAERLFGDHA